MKIINLIYVEYAKKEKIKYFVNDFDNYIIAKFDDNKFNICRLCYNRQNKFFCKNCNKNICKICYENCKNNNHNLLDLERYLDEVDKNKKNINSIIFQNHILPKEKGNFDAIEKKNRNYEIMNEF